MSSWYKHELANRRDEEEELIKDVMNNTPHELIVYMNSEDMKSFVREVFEDKEIYKGVRLSELYPIYDKKTVKIGYIYASLIDIMLDKDLAIQIKFMSKNGFTMYDWSYNIHRNDCTNDIYPRLDIHHITITDNSVLCPIKHMEIYQVADRTPEGILKCVFEYINTDTAPTVSGLVTKLDEYGMLDDYTEDYTELSQYCTNSDTTSDNDIKKISE